MSSLELMLENPTQISCDSGDCFYTNTISWRNPTTPNPTEAHPRIIFSRLFGDGGSASQRAARATKNGSILDSVMQEAASLDRSLGSGDHGKLTEYLDSVREIERRIQNAESQSARSVELPERPIDIPESFDEHAKLMFDLQALAYQADVTRVFTMVMGRELSARTFPNIGVPEQHHAVSHHRNDPDLIAKKAKIDNYHIQLLSYFLQRLQKTPDGDGSLLDHSLILYGGGMGNGNLHEHTRSADVARRKAVRPIEDGPAPRVSGQYADVESSRHDPRQGRGADRKAGRQHGPAAAGLSVAILKYECSYKRDFRPYWPQLSWQRSCRLRTRHRINASNAA